ncbi:MAG: hypothetical protein ACHQLQ_10790 [Candidatus Acidiferrales bacterium]
MVFGHNTNVTVDGTVYHVQTEDHGLAHALIDTTVYCRGRVLHRRTNNYFDLLPLDADREGALKERLDKQHRVVLEEIRSGVLLLKPPPAPSIPAPSTLTLELLNAKSWLVGKRATLQIAVRHKENGGGIAGAHVTAKIDGAATPAEFKTETRENGQAQLEFDMPRLSGAEPALVIEASNGEAKGSLRFQLRAKPRVPQA